MKHIKSINELFGLENKIKSGYDKFNSWTQNKLDNLSSRSNKIIESRKKLFDNIFKYLEETIPDDIIDNNNKLILNINRIESKYINPTRIYIKLEQDDKNYIEFLLKVNNGILLTSVSGVLLDYMSISRIKNGIEYKNADSDIHKFLLIEVSNRLERYFEEIKLFNFFIEEEDEEEEEEEEEEHEDEGDE